MTDEQDVYVTEVMVGHISTSTSDDGEPHPFGGWLYVPDLSSTTGWTSYELHRPEPPQRERHVGFRRRPVIRRGP